MKLVIFAGGIGTRLWPLSRRNSPKQFDKIFNGKSTLELAVERVALVFGLENIYIQTTREFKDAVKNQIRNLSSENIIVEPARRNVGPAVCLAMKKMKEQNYNGPVAILWADHLMERVEEFTEALKKGEKLIEENKNRFIFLAERPRFANNNLGWIKVGGEIGDKNYYSFEGWNYKPEQIECEKMFKDGNYFWNPGYFVSSVKFIEEKFKQLAPEIYEVVFGGNYGSAPAESFDRAVLEKLDHSDALVFKTNMGWSDPGTLYALKEALADSVDENVTQGEVYELNSKDCLIYNLENDKLVTAVGLNGIVVVNTKDALIVVPKEKVKEVTDLIKRLESEGLDKYL